LCHEIKMISCHGIRTDCLNGPGLRTDLRVCFKYNVQQMEMMPSWWYGSAELWCRGFGDTNYHFFGKFWFKFLVKNQF